ncbi:MAG TPA: ABC transporter permease subunit [Steroidobacteraceae bacterium]|nr:ABC transporter permease subunit [Steroidobacteraceae bacterium]
MGGFLAIARLTLLEARRRRIVAAAVGCGLIYLLLFATAVYFLLVAHRPQRPLPLMQLRAQTMAFTLVGLYAVNLLSVAVAIMLAVDTLSGEISSGIMQTLASKPIRRADIVLGKWAVFVCMIAVYILVMVAGVIATMHILTGYSQPHLLVVSALMTLQAAVLLSVVIVGGVRLPTVANGTIAFAFYSIAVVGGWVEQIGVVVGNDSARYIGTAISLVTPTDALWRLAVHELESALPLGMVFGPFSGTAVPTLAMVWWALGFIVCSLLLAIRWFQKRGL